MVVGCLTYNKREKIFKMILHDLIEHLFNPLLNDGGEILNSGEVLDDLGEHNKRVPERRAILKMTVADIRSHLMGTKFLLSRQTTRALAILL